MRCLSNLPKVPFGMFVTAIHAIFGVNLTQKEQNSRHKWHSALGRVVNKHLRRKALPLCPITVGLVIPMRRFCGVAIISRLYLTKHGHRENDRFRHVLLVNRRRLPDEDAVLRRVDITHLRYKTSSSGKGSRRTRTNEPSAERVEPTVGAVSAGNCSHAASC